MTKVKAIPEDFHTLTPDIVVRDASRAIEFYKRALSPLSIGGTGTTIHIYCEDVDDWFNLAVSAGATVTMPLMDQFWGDRYGKLTDPFGHQWSLATRIKDLSEEEIVEASKAAFPQMA